MAGIQRRQGPNAVGVYGRRTPMADGRKLLLKETVVPTAADEREKKKECKEEEEGKEMEKIE